MPTHQAVLDALSGVRDPELDEPITDLDFVSGLEIEGADASVRLRLPTYFCAPNFAYLMVADAKEAVLSVPGIERARWFSTTTTRRKRSTAASTNGAVSTGRSRLETESADLEELRTTFRRKSFVSRQEQLCRTLRSDGCSPMELASMTLEEVPPSDEFEKYLERRAELGLDVSAGAPLVVDPDGNRVPEEAVVQHLRFAKTVRVSIEGNASLCRGLLSTRYGIPEREEKTA